VDDGLNHLQEKINVEIHKLEEAGWLVKDVQYQTAAKSMTINHSAMVVFVPALKYDGNKQDQHHSYLYGFL
jgi:hypothetical protein